MSQIMEQMIAAALSANTSTQVLQSRLIFDIDSQKSCIHKRLKLGQQGTSFLVDVERQRVVSRVAAGRARQNDQEVQRRIDAIYPNRVCATSRQTHDAGIRGQRK